MGTKTGRYTIAKRRTDLELLIVSGIGTGGFSALMLAWICCADDKRFLIIPLIFIVLCFITFFTTLFEYLTKPKIAIQADCNGIYFYYRKNKEVYIGYNDIVEIRYTGLRNKYGKILIVTKENQYESICTHECNDKLEIRVKYLMKADDKEKYLKSIT